MSVMLKQLLTDKFNIDVTKRHLDKLKRHMIKWELRDTHPLALNTQQLGVEKIHFFEADRHVLFDLFHVDEKSFKRTINSAREIDPSHKVVSDAYNVLTVWIMHRVMRAKLSRSVKEDGLLTLSKLMTYKFFTGIVNYYLPYGADIEIMEATINGLSGKFDIKNYKTSSWKLVIESASKEVFDKRSIHYKRLDTFAKVGNQEITYVISDIQTRIRIKLQNIIGIFHANKERNNRILNSKMTDNIAGSVVIKSLDNNFELMINAVATDVLNINRFLVHDDITLVSKLTKAARADMVKHLLVKFSDIATLQHKRKKADEVIGSGKHTLIIGYRELVSSIIQKTYRYLILEGSVDMTSKVLILDRVRNVYRSSRVNDPDILIIKNSVDQFVNKYSDSKREATNAALKIAFILYIILGSFKSM